VSLHDPLHSLTDAELEYLSQHMDILSPEEAAAIEALVDELEKRRAAQACRDDLIEFCKRMQPDYIVGKHHRMLANELMAIASGEKDRICVNMPPRHGKSQLVSTYYPAWFLGKYPSKQVLLVSHTSDLAVDFGRKVRNIIDSDTYKTIFPTVSLAADSKSAGRWNTNSGGIFYATGVGSALAGRGADLLLVDDPHNEQDILNGNYEIFARAYEWFAFGARTRLMPGGRVAIVHTRWHQDDLTGRLVRDMTQNEGSDQYEIVEFPAIFNENTPNERPLWPEFFDLTALKRTKASMPQFQWNAQYQQNPTAEEGAIIRREWWQTWRSERPPQCEYIIMSLDAAAEAHNRADFTSLTTWGVFLNDETEAYNIILLNAIKKRVEFPELKDLAYQQYEEYQPDSFIVEKKSAGTALYQELRRTGMAVQEYTPHRGTGDKTARLNSVADIIRSGLVWVPETRWAEDLVEEIAGFPFMSNDDQVDSTVMALMRFRNGGFVRLPTDEPEEPQFFKARKRAYY